MGLENGAEVSGGTIVTGAAMGDLAGYTLTFSAQEEKPANFLAQNNAGIDASEYPFDDMPSATVTIVSGSDF